MSPADFPPLRGRVRRRNRRQPAGAAVGSRCCRRSGGVRRSRRGEPRATPTSSTRTGSRPAVARSRPASRSSSQLWGTDVELARRAPWLARPFVRRARLVDLRVVVPRRRGARARRARGAVVPSGVGPAGRGRRAGRAAARALRGRLSAEKGVARARRGGATACRSSSPATGRCATASRRRSASSRTTSSGASTRGRRSSRARRAARASASSAPRRWRTGGRSSRPRSAGCSTSSSTARRAARPPRDARRCGRRSRALLDDAELRARLGAAARERAGALRLAVVTVATLAAYEQAPTVSVDAQGAVLGLRGRARLDARRLPGRRGASRRGPAAAGAARARSPDVTVIVAAHDEETSSSGASRTCSRSTTRRTARDRRRLRRLDRRTDALVERSRRASRASASSAARAAARSRRRTAPCARRDAEVLAFSDANATWAPDALRQLVRSFADPEVAYVCGHLPLQRADGANQEGATGATSSGCAPPESRLGSVTGGNGSIYAVRREDYVEVDPRFGHDLSFPYLMVQRGRRAVYEPEAHAFEKPSPTPRRSTGARCGCSSTAG